MLNAATQGFAPLFALRQLSASFCCAGENPLAFAHRRDSSSHIAMLIAARAGAFSLSL